jgi:hypothetical protein
MQVKQKILAQIELHVMKDCLSDPFDIDGMYVDRGLDALLRYYAKRGTSPLESYHLSVQAILQGINAGPHLMHLLLLELSGRHNIKMGARNRGLYFPPHWDLQLLARINALAVKTLRPAPFGGLCFSTVPTDELFGCAALFQDQHHSIPMTNPGPKVVRAQLQF